MDEGADDPGSLFEAAAVYVQTTPLHSTTPVPNDVKLQLYGLFKQATEGDVNTPQPGLLNMKARAKWEAWKQHTGKSRESAMADYVALVYERFPGFSDSAGQQGEGLAAPTTSTLAGGDTAEEVAETLHEYAGLGEVLTVQQMLDAGENIDALDADGATALHWCCDRGQVHVARVLLQRGANIAAVDAALMTPLHYAALNSHEDVAALLVQAGANPQAPDEEGVTPKQLEPSWPCMQAAG